MGFSNNCRAGAGAESRNSAEISGVGDGDDGEAEISATPPSVSSGPSAGWPASVRNNGSGEEGDAEGRDVLDEAAAEFSRAAVWAAVGSEADAMARRAAARNGRCRA